MKIKSLLSKFQPKKRNKNVLKGDKNNISSNNSSNNSSKKKQKRRNRRNIINVGSPSSSLITQKTDSYCDDDGSDRIYHPEYIPPSPTFAPTTINSPLNYEQGQVGETDLSRPSEQKQALNENLYSQDVVVRENETESRQGSPQIEKKRFVHNGVTSQMVWMNATLLDDISEDDDDDADENDDENIHSSEYLSASAGDKNDYAKYRDDYALNRPMTLTSLALDSTRASNIYRTYESDFDDFGLVTGVAVIDGNGSEEDDIVGDLPYHKTSQQQSDDMVNDPPLLPLDKSDDDDSDDDENDYSIPKEDKGINPIRWPSQATDMAGPVPPEPEPAFPMDEMYDDLRVRILDDDVSALSSDTPPPTVYRNVQQELRRRPSVKSSKLKPPATTSSWTCHPSFLRRSSLQKIAEDDDDKLRVADMFSKVFHCVNNAESNSSSQFPAGTTITVSATRSGSRSNSHPPLRYESIDECVEA